MWWLSMCHSSMQYILHSLHHTWKLRLQKTWFKVHSMKRTHKYFKPNLFTGMFILCWKKTTSALEKLMKKTTKKNICNSYLSCQIVLFVKLITIARNYHFSLKLYKPHILYKSFNKNCICAVSSFEYLLIKIELRSANFTTWTFFQITDKNVSFGEVMSVDEKFL